MKVIDILTHEHALILQAIACLSSARDMLERGERPPKDFFVLAMDFLKSFADEFHHFKEEYLMFVLLAEKKDGQLDIDIGALRFQHEKGRKYIKNIEDALEEYTGNNEIATTLLLENLASYVSLLRRHIFLEDQVFFKLAEKALTEAEDNALMAQFDQEEQRIGQGNFINESQKRLIKFQSLLPDS